MNIQTNAGGTASRENLLIGSIAAEAAALVGAIAWAAVVVVSNYELGILAWAIGWLVGFAVSKVGKCTGSKAQIIAGFFAFVGIALGKYFAISYFIDVYAVEELGEEPAFLFGIFLPEQIEGFFQALPEISTPFDVLWVILALVTAVSMTKRRAA